MEEKSSGDTPTGISMETVGSATISPNGEFTAGSYASFVLTYTAGFYGIDDTGSLKIVFRYATDQGQPQFSDPAAANYVTVSASNEAVLEVRFDPKGNVRPWDKCLYIKVVRGYLKEGDQIKICFGDTSGGSPGIRLQTFCEKTFEFRVLVDAIATYTYVPVSTQPQIAIIPGPVSRWRVVAPSIVGVGSSFSLKVKGEDRWGNPTNLLTGSARLVASDAVAGLPANIAFANDEFTVTFNSVEVMTPGVYRFSLLSDAGECLATSNPVRAVDGNETGWAYWGDLHGQSEETVGSNSAREYFEFGRDRAFLDVLAHQGNDFQITDEFWTELNHLTAEFNVEGKFVTLPGFEWSGNTSLGGDRNVFFAEEGSAIYRSSQALVNQTKFTDEICPTAEKLFEALTPSRDRVICYAHCGGRYADIKLAHNGHLERSIEIHSSWGTFEWLLHDALEMGYRVGIVANSDGHKGRPGASYPGTSTFGAIGGLTCFRMEELSRRALLDCLRKRRHFATTGNRAFLDVEMEFEQEGTVFHEDPALTESRGQLSRKALMGDIVHLPHGDALLKIQVLGTAPIVKIDLFNGLDHVYAFRPYSERDLGSTLRIIWQGAQHRGRFRDVVWDGHAEIAGNRIASFSEINFLNPERAIEQAENKLHWQSLTTGNMSGFQLKLADASAGRLKITTPIVALDLGINEIGYEEILHQAGGIGRQLSVVRVPDSNKWLDVELDHPIRFVDHRDNAIFVRVTDEQGNQAWSSPIYVFR